MKKADEIKAVNHFRFRFLQGYLHLGDFRIREGAIVDADVVDFSVKVRWSPAQKWALVITEIALSMD